MWNERDHGQNNSEDVHSIMVSDICSIEFSLNSSVRLSVFVKPKKKLKLHSLQNLL